MNPKEIKKILGALGSRPNKTLGQHFLIDRAALDAVVNAADVKKGDRILEIGPGLGVLTRALLEKGAEVIAIEKDKKCVAYLSSGPAALVSRRTHCHSVRRELSTRVTRRQPRCKIMEGDAAKMDWDVIVGNGTWKFVSNLPYAITSLAIRKALWARNTPTKVVALVQKEVADRIVSPKMSLLALMVALSSASVRVVKRVPAGAFYPPPKVESAILEIVPMAWDERIKRWGVHPDDVMRLAKKGFAHPRKLLKSNLAIGSDVLRHVGIHEKARAEDVTVEQWGELAKHI